MSRAISDEQYEAFKGKVLGLIEKWRWTLGLGGWKIEVSWYEGAIDSEGGQHLKAAATCKADWRYREADMAVSVRECQGYHDDDLEAVIVHELCHCLTEPLRMVVGPYLNEHDEQRLEFDGWYERLTTDIQRAVTTAYQAGYDQAKEDAEPAAEGNTDG